MDRYEEDGKLALGDRSKAPHCHPNATSPEIVEAVLALRMEHPRWGARTILNILKRKNTFDNLSSHTTVNKYFKDNGLIKERRRRKRTEQQFPIFDPQEPNLVWSADFNGQFRMGNRVYCYPLTIADSYSMFILAAKALPGANTKLSKPVSINVFREYGLPDQLHTDNGAPFGSINGFARLTEFAVWIMDLGIKPVYSDPGHPEQNGRHERMHRELKGEATRPPGFNLQAQQRKLNKFIYEYNFIRPYQTLNDKLSSELYVRSEKEYPERIRDWDYPKLFKTRNICRNGAIRVGRTGWIYVSKALISKNIGLEELGNGIYKLFYRQFFIGYLDENEWKVYDFMDYNYKMRV